MADSIESSHFRQRLWAVQHRYAPYLFLSPFMVLFSVFMLWPMLRSLILSLYKTAGPQTERFVGLANYQFILQDRVFHIALAGTLGYALVVLLLQLPLSLGLALLLNNPRIALRNVFRFAFFCPYLVGHVFVAVIFSLMLAKNGPVNEVLSAIPGFAPLSWTTNPVLARIAIPLAILWTSVGYAMVYLLAALQSVDRELYEAAAVDGAGPWSRFFHVTLPGIRHVLTFLLLVGMIGMLQLFELPYVLFQGAGPGLAGLTIVMYLFQWGWEFGDIGYASAVGWVLALLILAMTLALVRITGAARED